MTGRFDIYLLDVVSGQFTQLTRDGANNEHPVWSPRQPPPCLRVQPFREPAGLPHAGRRHPEGATHPPGTKHGPHLVQLYSGVIFLFYSRLIFYRLGNAIKGSGYWYTSVPIFERRKSIMKTRKSLNLAALCLFALLIAISGGCKKQVPVAPPESTSPASPASQANGNPLGRPRHHPERKVLDPDLEHHPCHQRLHQSGHW